MLVSVIIATYGEDSWADLAQTRALPSAEANEPYDILIGHDPEGTIASVRNMLAAEAVGDWLCFLDADDELAPNFLGAMERVYEQLNCCKEGALARERCLLTPAVQQVKKGRPGTPFFFDRGIPLTEDNWLILGTLVCKDLFMEVGGFSDYPHGFEDWSLWAKCWKAGAQVVKVPAAVYIAHVNPQSKHKIGWRDRKWQVAMHKKVKAEIFG